MTKATHQTIDQYWHKDGVCCLITRAALRTLQFVLAVTVAGLYGVDLAHSTKTQKHAYSQWVYAEFVAALSALTCIVHFFVTVTRVAWSAWDGMLFVLWLAQFGVFGTIYISNVEDEYENATLSVHRMRAAVWIDLVNMLLWFATTVLGIGWCIRTRKVTRRTDQFDASKAQLSRRSSEQRYGSDGESDLESIGKGSLDSLSTEKFDGKCVKESKGQTSKVETDEKREASQVVKD